MRATTLVIPIPATHDRWELDEEDMPETALHDLVITLLASVFRAWIVRTKRDAMAGSNIAVRWDREHPSRGVDPDVYLVEPAPPEGEKLKSLCLWKKGHNPPRVSVEVVSENTHDKDFGDGPARHGASGARELWVFDPERFGPDKVLVQLWRRTPKGSFKRVYSGDGPVLSRELGSWVVVTNGGTRLRVADDAAGTKLWPTEEESARQDAEREREQAEQEREQAVRARTEAEKARDAAEAEIARLRALLPPGVREPRAGSYKRRAKT